MKNSHTARAIVAGLIVLMVLVAAYLPQLEADGTDPSSHRQSEGDGERQMVRTLLRRYCFGCHAGETPEANVRLDTLELSSSTAGDSALLQTLLSVVGSGQMPPEEAESPRAEERRLLTSWLTRRLTDVADEARRARHWTRNRRLTVEQYNVTMQSLFGVDANFADGLPPDPVSHEGFQNDSELLGLSTLQMECYLDSARRAVERYVQFGTPDNEPVRYHIELEDLYYSTADRYGTRDRAPRPVDREVFEARHAANRLASVPEFVGPLSPIPPGRFPKDEALREAIPKLHQQYVALPEWMQTGELIVRIRAAATPDRHGRFPRMRVESGITLGDGDSMDKRTLGEIDVTAPRDEPEVYEFCIRAEDVPTKGVLREEDTYDRLSVFDMVQVFVSNVSRDDQAIYGLGRGGYPTSESDRVEAPLEQMAEAGVNFLYLDCIEIELLPDGSAGRRLEWTVDAETSELDEDAQKALASEVLARFMRRAYRRPVSAAEVDKKMELFEELRASEHSFEQSLREALTAVLVSPSFLFLESWPANGGEGKTVRPTPHQLASRLSYLLWLAPPDEQLMQRADDGSLVDQAVWAGEAERLLRDPRARRFLDSFCRQWLRLDRHANIAVDPETHPTYDEDLAEDTLQETLNFFADVFHADSSALELIDSNYVLVNDRLADHYELDAVIEGEFRKVPLPPGSARGGLLTQASLLTLNSDGIHSHPIRRGVWLLERFLNAPPPPPPPDVPALDDQDPDFSGLSLKEKLKLHRKPGACQSCHRKIDPWGLALENFDATGRWRETVPASQGSGKRNSPVDAAVQLPGGPRIDGVGQLKRYLYEERRHQFTRALVHHMFTYAMGRSPDYLDQPQVEAIHQRFAASGYRLRELVLAIVGSDVFRQ